jgi:hypothetical protein
MAGVEIPWREAFDAVERPLASVSESWVQSDAFMDAFAFTFKLQRRAARRVESAAGPWLRLFGLPTRADVAGLANQIARLERELRDLRRTVEDR